jgi:hypothetical protein
VGEAGERRPGSPTDPLFALRKRNWGAAWPVCFRKRETSGRGSRPMVSVLGFPGTRSGLGTERKVGIIPQPRALPAPEAPPAFSAASRPADPVGPGKLDSAHTSAGGGSRGGRGGSVMMGKGRKCAAQHHAVACRETWLPEVFRDQMPPQESWNPILT